MMLLYLILVLTGSTFCATFYNSAAIKPGGGVAITPKTPYPVLQSLLSPATTGGINRVFGNNGSSYIASAISPGSDDDEVNAMAIDSNTRIVLAGFTTPHNTNPRFAIARYLPSGVLDGHLASDGFLPGTAYIPFAIATLPGVANANDNANAVAIDTSERIIVGGASQAKDGNTYFALACFLPSGQLDQSFGGFNGANPGTQFINFSIGGVSPDTLNALYIDSQGRIITAGNSNVGGPNFVFSVARFLANGQLDLSFGGFNGSQKGTQLLPPISAIASDDTVLTLTVDAQGRIILAGRTTQGATGFFAVARLLDSGQPDPSFGGQHGAPPGTTYLNFSIAGGTNIDQVLGVAVNLEEIITLGGTSYDAGNKAHYSLAQLLESGNLNLTFGGQNGAPAGTTFIPTLRAGGSDSVCSMQTENQNSFILGGRTTDAVGNTFFSAARFLSSGTLDLLFGGQNGSPLGTQYFNYYLSGAPLGAGYDQENALAISPNGSLLLAGYSRTPLGNPKFAIGSLFGLPLPTDLSGFYG